MFHKVSALAVLFLLSSMAVGANAAELGYSTKSLGTPKFLIECSSDGGGGRRVVDLTQSKYNPSNYYVDGEDVAGGDDVHIYSLKPNRIAIYAGLHAKVVGGRLSVTGTSIDVLTLKGEPASSASNSSEVGTPLKDGQATHLSHSSFATTGVDGISCSFTYLG